MVIYLFLFTTFLLFLFSSIYHTFSCHSLEVCECCYKLDLTGIMFQFISSTICSHHFMFHEFENIRIVYTCVFFGLGIITIIISAFDFFVSAKLNNFLMFLYAFLFFTSFLSSIHWASVANIIEVEIFSKYIFISFGCLFIGFILFFSKFPECVIQNKFIDHFIQSHTLWHISIIGCTVGYYVMLYQYYTYLENIRGT